MHGGEEEGEEARLIRPWLIEEQGRLDHAGGEGWGKVDIWR